MKPHPISKHHGDPLLGCDPSVEKHCIRTSDVFYCNTCISASWGFWSVQSFVGGWHRAHSVLENILWAITWAPLVSHIPQLPLVFPWNQTYQSVLGNSAWSYIYVSSCCGCSVSLAIYLSVCLFIYLHFLMLILLLCTQGKLLFKLLSCLDKNEKACGGNIHVSCVWARVVIFNHSC